MVYEFRLPDIGEGVAQGEIVSWHVKEGDVIREDQPLVSVLTDKANVEIPSPRAGKVLSLHAKEGEIVKVGALLVTLDAPAGPGATPSGASLPPATPPVTHPAPAPTGTPSGGGRVMATPSVRRKAQELGVDLARVKGTGPGGRILETDLTAARPGPAGAQPAYPTPGPGATVSGGAPPPRAFSGPEGEVERIPIRGIRRAIFERMAEAQRYASLFTYVEEVDVSELVRLRERSRKKLEERGIPLTYLPFILKASVQGLKAHPRLNAQIDEEKQELVVHRRFHLGVALASAEGLLVPVVKDVDTKSIYRLAQELKDLGERGRQGKLTRDELTGSTFTVTSLGALGGLMATPIVNYPEVAILGVHKIVKRPVYGADGSVGPAMLMNLSVSFDHRVLDGIEAAEFIAVVKGHLEDPHQMLLELS